MTHTVKVLLVEDNEVIRREIRKLLERSPNIEILGEAHDGVEAMLLVKSVHADVLLLDVEMPRLSGIEVARQVSRLPDKPNILVLSAHDDQKYIQAMLANGAAGYLLKDEAPGRIIQAIMEVAPEYIDDSGSPF